MSWTPTVLLSSRTQVIESTYTGRRYRITVSLPAAYNAPADEKWPFANPPEKWPTIYVLDGNWHYALVTETLRPMGWCGGTTDAIVVGIGYEEIADDPIESWWIANVGRGPDMQPVPDDAEEKEFEAFSGRSTPAGGRGPEFLKFLQHELMPLIESEFRSDPAMRVFMGFSFGALFGAYAMFEAPGMFHSMIIGSPNLKYGDYYIQKREAAFAQLHKQLPVRLFLFVGELEEYVESPGLTDLLRFATILESRGYERFSITKRVFRDTEHCHVVGPGYAWGMQHALKKP